MKFNMKALLVLLTLAALPGCGKKGNDAIANVSGVGSTSSSVSLNGQCYYMNNLAYGGGQTAALTFQGTMANYGYGQNTSTIQAVVTGSSFAFPGTQYSHSDGYGDSLQVYVSGSTVYAYATLSAVTVAYLQQLNAPVCAIYINSGVGLNSQLTYSSFLGVTQNGGQFQSLGISI
jgi:hypothetical protein